MSATRIVALLLFAVAVGAGTSLDVEMPRAPRGPTVLAGDFHVHAFPGDGALPVWELQREAARRGLDVIAITNHNHNVALRLAQASGLVRDYPIVISSQELTTPKFHMAAVGVQQMIDWRLSAREAIAAIHAQGGVAIAAHPIQSSWEDADPQALAMLDGAEVAHPGILFDGTWEGQLEQFFDTARQSNPDLAPVGSSDHHGGGPMGLCRTYLLVDEVSREGVLDAIRRGRTVASGPGDRLVGAEAHLRVVRDHLAPAQHAHFGFSPSTFVALVALAALGLLVVRD